MSRHRALITGASAGIGRELAGQLAAAGKDLVLVARREERLIALAAELRETHGVDVEVIQADLSDPDAPAALFEETRRRNLEVDYLVNNAGSSGPDLLSHRSWSDNGQYLQLMTTSVAAMCHFFIPPMRERGFGRVLNVASVAGLLTVSRDYSYGPTKAYLVALSKGLANALRNDGILVTALCPGFTHTDFHASEKLANMKRSTPGFIWYDVDVVVREGLRALERGRAVYISGRLYRFLVPILRTPPSRWLISALGVKL
jgi:short-subunit dehydrogenase